MTEELDFAAAPDLMDKIRIEKASTLTDGLKQQLQEASRQPSRVDQLRSFAEVLYANMAELDKETKLLAMQLTGIASRFEFINSADRGVGMIAAFKREAGEKGNWPKPEKDPEPLAQYVAAKAIADAQQPRPSDNSGAASEPAAS